MAAARPRQKRRTGGLATSSVSGFLRHLQGTCWPEPMLATWVMPTYFAWPPHNLRR
jgi:hypothetical protein